MISMERHERRSYLHDIGLTQYDMPPAVMHFGAWLLSFLLNFRSTHAQCVLRPLLVQ